MKGIKEQAEDLYNKYFLKMENGIDENGVWICMALNKGMAKGCTLIAVDLVLTTIDSEDYISRAYWRSIKKEIEKL